MTEFYVKVKPDSKEFDIQKGTFPEFYLESEAENGKANTELLKRLEQILGKKPGITSGHRSRRKKLTVDIPEEELEEKMEAEYNG